MRLIDGDALYRYFTIGSDGQRFPERDCDNFFIQIDIAEVKQIIRNAPTIDPVKRGEWIDSPSGDYVICSWCHAEWNVFDNDTYRFRRCPACGADLREEKEGVE